MGNHLSKGQAGEQAALRLLQEKGHTILHTNYRWERKEVDIISLDGNVLVFTEVKTRSSFDFGYPEAAVDTKKQEHIKQVADAFLTDNPQYEQIRFDTIAVILKGKSLTEIVHWEDAFY